MAKSVSNDVLDGALSVIQSGCDKMVACAQEPAGFVEAESTFALADVAMAPADFTLSDGDLSGRKVSVAQKQDVPVDAPGTANHVALLDTSTSRLLYVTTTADKVLQAGDTLTFAGWDIEIADPS